MSVPFSNTKLRVPKGFQNVLEGLAREVLRCQPDNIYLFAADYFEEILRKREETGYDDVTLLGAKLEDRFYNNHSFKNPNTNTNNDEQQSAAVLIQSEYRRFAAKKEVDNIKEEEAATVIQASVRGHIERNLIKADGTEAETEDEKITDEFNLAENKQIISEEDEGLGQREEEFEEAEVKFEEESTLEERENSALIGISGGQNNLGFNDDKVIDIDPNDPELHQAALTIQTAFKEFKNRKQKEATEDVEEVATILGGNAQSESDEFTEHNQLTERQPDDLGDEPELLEDREHEEEQLFEDNDAVETEVKIEEDIDQAIHIVEMDKQNLVEGQQNISELDVETRLEEQIEQENIETERTEQTEEVDDVQTSMVMEDIGGDEKVEQLSEEDKEIVEENTGIVEVTGNDNVEGDAETISELQLAVDAEANDENQKVGVQPEVTPEVIEEDQPVVDAEDIHDDQPAIDAEPTNGSQLEGDIEVTNENHSEVNVEGLNEDQQGLEVELNKDDQPDVDAEVANDDQPDVDAEVANEDQPDVDAEVANEDQPDVDTEVANEDQPDVDAEVANEDQPGVDAEVAYEEQPEVDVEVSNESEQQVIEEEKNEGESYREVENVEQSLDDVDVVEDNIQEATVIETEVVETDRTVDTEPTKDQEEAEEMPDTGAVTANDDTVRSEDADPVNDPSN